MPEGALASFTVCDAYRYFVGLQFVQIRVFMGSTGVEHRTRYTATVYSLLCVTTAQSITLSQIGCELSS